MRLLEILLLVALAAATLSQLARRRWVWRAGRGWAVLLVALLALHVAIEGPRAPLAVAYALVALVALAAVRPTVPAVRARGAHRQGGRWLGAALLLALAAGPAWLFPVFELPAPAGPFGVGSTWYALTDGTREETLGPAPGGSRSVVVRVWYPTATGATGAPAPYALDRAELGGLFGMLRLDFLLGGQLDYVKTHSVRDAELAPPPAGGWPVLVFSHGYTGFAAQNTPQVEDLAGRGYVVFSISHTHDAGGTVFPDGRIVPLDPAVMAMFSDMAGMQDSIAGAMAALEAATTPDARQRAFREFLRHNGPRINASVPVWKGDTRFLLDRLERLAPGEPGGRFAGALDLERIGILGMSFGGSNAGEVCRVDRRCKAGLNLDGQQFGPLVLEDSLTVPFMIISSNLALPVHWPAFDRLRGPGYLVHLRGTEHLGLTDASLVSPRVFRWMGLIGTMPVDRTEALLTEYIGAFFDHYLRGRPAPVLTAPPPREDVEFVTNDRVSGY